VQLVDHLLGWDADGAHEERSLALDDDVREFRQLTVRVVVLSTDELGGTNGTRSKTKKKKYIRLARIPADLREQ